MPTLDQQIEVKIREILFKATAIYEGDPRNGLQEMPFLFLLQGEGEVAVVPVRVEMDPLILTASSTMFRGAARGAYLEQIALQTVWEKAGTVPPWTLLGVGYLFPASGDFPQTDLETAQAHLLRAKGEKLTPWSQEGVVFILDTPEGRKTWACLRDPGEVADPLHEPRRLRVEAAHVFPLYPHPAPEISWS